MTLIRLIASTGLLILCGGLLPTTSLYAEKIKHGSAGVSVWVPDQWKREQKNDLMIVSDQSSGLIFAFVITERVEEHVALKMMQDELANYVEGIQVDGLVNHMKVNGLEGIFVDGGGLIKGDPVQVGMAMFYTPNDMMLMLLGITNKGNIEKNSSIIKKILLSVAPL